MTEEVDLSFTHMGWGYWGKDKVGKMTPKLILREDRFLLNLSKKIIIIIAI